MANATYTPGVYRAQGGNQLVIARTGELLVEGTVRGTAKGYPFFVDSATGSNSNDGTTWSSAVATIDYAIGLCTASRGDTIYVAPGHTETVTGAAGVALDVAGVSIVGIGNGRLRPKVDFTTAAGASFDISAANCRVENLWFNCSIDDQTAMVNITAADVTLVGCEFMMEDGTYDAEIGVLISAAGDRFRITECNFWAVAGSTDVAGAISFGAADNGIIERCNFTGYFGTSGAILNAAAAVNGIIRDNVILNRTADGNNKTIVLHGSTAYIIANNRGGIIDSTGPAPVTAAAGWVGGNWWSSNVGVTASVLM